MTGPAVRLAVPADLDHLPEIERSAATAFEGTDLLKSLKSLFNPAEIWRPALEARTLWVTDDADGAVAGFLAASVVGDTLHIDELDVRRQFQGRGRGRALIAAAVAHANERGLAAVTLTTFRRVLWNAPFYRRLGFEEIGTADLPSRLADLLAHEARLGLDPATRCAMRLTLRHSAPMTPEDSPSQATRLVRVGHAPTHLARTVGPPIQRGSTVLVAEAAALYDESRPTYGRGGLATQETLIDALAQLEGASAVRLFPSGLAAVAGAVLAVLKAGDEVIVTDAAYKPTRRFCDRVLARFGIAVRYCHPRADADALMALASPATRLIVLESPGSLTFEMQDAPGIAAAARRRGILTLMDNTWAAGLYFKPLAHGIDLSVQALTKYVGGHADVFMGSAATAHRAIAEALDHAILDFGWAVSPDDAYQMLRGLRTLPTRLARHQQSGLAVAEWLRRQPEVAQVLHPALPGTLDHDLWKRDYTGAAGLFGVILTPRPPRAVRAFMDSLSLFGLGFSWGGFESLVLDGDPQLAVRADRPTLDGPLIRLNIGLEDPGDLIADLRHGLDVFAAAG